MSSIAKRLDAHFVACAAAAGAAVVGTANTAQAAIISSGPVNINIPSTTSGVYLNVQANTTGGSSSLAGWDVNLYGGSSLIGWQSTPTTPANVWVSTGGFLNNLPTGTMIDAASVYGSTSPSASTTAPAGNVSVLNGINIYGFKFINEANGNQIHYGWVKVSVGATFAGQPRAIIEYAYESVAGAGIPAGVPAPGSAALLALGALGMASRRRK